MGLVPHSFHINGWVTLAVVKGIDSVASDLSIRCDTFSIICGLFLSVTLNLVADTPERSENYIEDSGVGIRVVYFSFLTLSIVFHFLCILVGSLLSVGLKAAARDADKFRLILRNGTTPTIVDTAFTVGNILLASALAIFMSPTY